MLEQYGTKRLLEIKGELENLMRAGQDEQPHIILYGHLKEELDKRKVDAGKWLINVKITN